MTYYLGDSCNASGRSAHALLQSINCKGLRRITMINIEYYRYNFSMKGYFRVSL